MVIHLPAYKDLELSQYKKSDVPVLWEHRFFCLSSENRLFNDSTLS